MSPHHVVTASCPSRVSRRAVLFGAPAAVGATAFGFYSPASVGVEPWSPVSNPFTLGVASGDPRSDGVVLWTRLAPRPLDGGGMPDRLVDVEWQVATDELFTRIVASGTEVATPRRAHSVHVEVSGLQSGAEYFYRFRLGKWLSRIGRTKTAPAVGTALGQFAFAFTSCQNWQAGYFTAHRHLAHEELDLVVQLGDYIYETKPEPGVRRHEGHGEAVTLRQYRNRHAQYKTDPDLQAAHAAFPWVVALDDHEVDNNWADENPQDPGRQSRQEFLNRRAAAFRAYYEHMPLRRTSMPRDIHMQLYRRLTLGNLVDLHVLDTRQYRSNQVADRRRFASRRTMLGYEQESWLGAALAGPTAKWNILAQQVFFSQRDLDGGPGKNFGNDGWDNYAAARGRLRRHIVDARTSNPVVITGDVHTNYVCDVKADFNNPDSATVATELVGTSVTSGGNGIDRGPRDVARMGDNPHIKFVNHKRGYVRNVVTPDQWRADFRVVDYVRSRGAPIRTRASFVIEDGVAGAHPA